MTQDQSAKEQETRTPGAAGQKPQTPVTPPPAPVSRAQIFTFWGAVAVALIAARVLDNALPGTPERVIERWIMLAFGAFLAVFLLRLK